MTARPAFPTEWTIGTYDLLANTHTSLVWKVVRNDHPGEVFVIKQLKPAGIEELRGAHYLIWQNGHGTTRLYDLKNTSMLLEYAGDYHLNEHLKNGHDAETLVIFGDVLKALHTPSPIQVPKDLQPLHMHFSSLFAATAKHPAYAEAADLAQRLLTMPHRAIPLHGDIHHENIIKGPRGWLAIDPHGLIGDAAFDTSNIFYNPLDRADLCLDISRAKQMAEYFSSIIGCSAAHILDYAFVYGCLSAAWYSEDGNDKNEERQLKIATALKVLRQKSYSL